MTQTLYHVTTSNNLPGIEIFGLMPNLGPRAASLDGEKAGVFLFTTKDAVDDALNNWLGEAFEDTPDPLIVLSVELPADFPLEQDVEYEKIARRSIPAAAITAIHLPEAGGPVYKAKLATSDSWICGLYSVLDGYPFISVEGNPLIIRRSSLTVVAETAL